MDGVNTARRPVLPEFPVHHDVKESRHNIYVAQSRPRRSASISHSPFSFSVRPAARRVFVATESNLTKAISKLYRSHFNQSQGRISWSGKTPAKENGPKTRESTELVFCFPQFCPTCEREIIQPNYTILYCSERCRRSDSNRPIMASELSPPVTPPTIASGAPPTIVEPLSPTCASSNRTGVPKFHASDATDRGNVSPLYSPTSRSGKPIRHSPASVFLAQFQRRVPESTEWKNTLAIHSTTLTPDTPPRSCASSQTGTPDREGAFEAHASVKTNLSAAGSYLADVNKRCRLDRPLPPRSNPEYSLHDKQHRDIDLVIPRPTAIEHRERQADNNITHKDEDVETHRQEKESLP
ncbi:hypothetical protein VTO42DRAFT_8837 [Malbranchea cinnamomea]